VLYLTNFPYYHQRLRRRLIPHIVDDFTNSISPAKLNEYLPLGKPAVSIDLAEVRHFNEAHGGLVRIDGTSERFLAEVRRAFSEDSSTLRHERRMVAKRSFVAWHVSTTSRLIDRGNAEQSTMMGREQNPRLLPSTIGTDLG